MNRRLLGNPPAARHDWRDGGSDIICDVAIIGGGIAGLSVALSLPADLHTVVVTKHILGESNTRYAQGGLAAPVAPDDSPSLHLSDTLLAGAGLVDERAARILVDEAREAVAWLIASGTEFDLNSQTGHAAPDGDERGGRSRLQSRSLVDLSTDYDLAREAAHSRRRVLHAKGDATGAEIERALVQALREHPSRQIMENATALELLVSDGVCVGVQLRLSGRSLRLLARRGVVLANGGAGQLWKRTSNPKGATADGIALASRAGAALADLEFMQFHPTVFVPPQPDDEPFLISEAVRGEGAYLRNAAGERFMHRYHPDAELAPRDVVARAIHSELRSSGAATVYLDLRHIPEPEVRHRFPTIGGVCRHYGFDLAHDLIPVAPAAHYFMGGVAVDTYARTTLPKLYAVGEVACTGVHGANRLASNSLLEGLVFGRRAARAITEPRALPSWPEQPALKGAELREVSLVEPRVSATAAMASRVREIVRTLMWEQVALVREASGLQSAEATLRALAAGEEVDPETANMLRAAHAITVCALARDESRGAHYRLDYPESDPERVGMHTLLWMRPTVATVQGTEGLASHVTA